MGHFYDREGNPVYQVAKKDGDLRPTTVRDARSLKLVPSVTTITNLEHREALVDWRLKRMAEAKGDWDAYTELTTQASELGTQIHGEIESYLKDGGTPTPTAQCAVRALERTYTGGVSEQAFAHPMGFGGKVDHHLPGPPGHVVDFKSKPFTEINAKGDGVIWAPTKGEKGDWKVQTVLYDSHFMQLAAYRMGLGLPKARGTIIFVSTLKPGLTVTKEAPEDKLEWGWKRFLALFECWKVLKKFNPSFYEPGA
jgi:hypothetical protein